MTKIFKSIDKYKLTPCQQKFRKRVTNNLSSNTGIKHHTYGLLCICKSCHFHIRDIRRIRHLLSPSILITLANSLVSSKLDYCNSLYNGINTTELNKLQVIQNSLARAITFTSKREHIKPVLQELHWLPIKQRIEFKTCLLTYKSLKNDQPIYLRKILSFPSHTIHTRSTNSNALFPHSATTSMGKKAFLLLLLDSGILFLPIPAWLHQLQPFEPN